MESPENLNPVQIRSSLGWSQKRMADHLGCNQSTICRIERTRKISGPIRKLYEQIAFSSADFRPPIFGNEERATS